MRPLHRSTVAYQGYGRGLDRAFVEAANAFACQGIVPDRTILLVADSAAEGLERARAAPGPIAWSEPARIFMPA